MKIILEGPEGQRLVEAGVPYKRLPGEKIIGSERGVEAPEEGFKFKFCSRCKQKGIFEYT